MFIGKENIIYEGEWIIFKSKRFGKDKEDLKHIWEYIERPTENTGGANSIPVVYNKADNTKYLLLIANFRVPIEQYVLEFPAGMVDSKEDELKAIKREIEEETGFTVDSKIPNILDNIESYIDAYKSNEREKIYLCKINHDDITILPKQKLDDTEDIKVHLIKIDDNLSKSILELKDKHNYCISNNVTMFLHGINFFNNIN